MNEIQIVATKTYLDRLTEVEDFIHLSSPHKIIAVEKFLEAHEEVLEFIRKNPDAAPIHQFTQDQSWPFMDGVYRIFFKRIETTIYLIDLVDNRAKNIDLYPSHELISFDEDSSTVKRSKKDRRWPG